MDDLILEPYAVVQKFEFPKISDRWEELLSEYLVSLAEKTTLSRSHIIGHIKALSVFEGNQYFRLSVIAPKIPLTMEGKVPDGKTELEVTLNVLVYGLSEPELEEITRAAADDIAVEWGGRIR